MSGFWSGISSWFGKILSGIGGFISGVVGKVTGFLGIHSPSSVFEDIGANMMKGMSLGIEGRLSSVGSISGRAAGQMASSAAAGIGGAGAMNGGSTKNTTIIVNNPLGENSDQSVKNNLQKLSYLGVV
jgi:phage-related protein